MDASGDPQIHAEVVRLLEAAQHRQRAAQTQLDALTSARGAGSDDDEHDPEGVPLSAQWSMLRGIQQSANDELAQLEAAVFRIHDGTFGTCVVCGKAIPAAQLEVRPYRDRCVACAA